MEGNSNNEGQENPFSIFSLGLNDEDTGENMSKRNEKQEKYLKTKQEKRKQKEDKYKKKIEHKADSFLIYNTTQGQTDKSGMDFEIKMAELLYLRAVRLKYKFHLATGMEAAGKFDDIVFEYDDGAKVNTTLIQLKHKKSKIIKLQDLLTCNKSDSDFSLIKYYKSFCDIRKNYVTNTGMKWNGSFEDFRFVLCTNAVADLEGMSFLRAADCNESYIIDTGGKVYKFAGNENIISELKTKLGSEVDLSHLNEFLEKTILLAHQADRNHIDQHIKHEIINVYKVSMTGADAIFKEYYNPYIESWWEGSSNAKMSLNEFSFTSKDAFAIIEDLNMHKKLQFNQLKIEFKQESIERLKDTLMISENVVNVIASQTSTNLSCLKLYKSFQNVTQRSLVVSSGKLLDNEFMKQVQNVWPTEWCPVIIIEEEKSEKEADKTAVKDAYRTLVSKMSPTVAKLIAVSEKDESLITSLNTIPSKIIETSCKITELTKSSVDRVLETVVNFQGFQTPIGKILRENAEELIGPEFLSKLLTYDEVISIGKSIGASESYHLNRYLEHRIYVKTSLLCGNVSNSFGITGVSEKEIPELIMALEKQNNTKNLRSRKLSDKLHSVTKNVPNFKYVVRSMIRGGFGCSRPRQDVNKSEKEHAVHAVENSEQFDQLCKTDEHVHWLEIKDGIIKWRKSKGDMGVIQANIDDKCDVYEVKTVWDIPDNIVLVTSEPGMGKSTLVSQVAYDTKAKHPSMLIIKINLNECTTFLSTLDLKNITDVEVINFLMLSEDKIVNPYEEKIFRNMLKHPERVVLLVDSFDEIMPLYDDHVLAMLARIREIKFAKLWLASRSVLNTVLEQELGTLAYSIKPLDTNEQTNFLMKYWKYKGIDTDIEQLQSFTEKVLGTVDNKTFLGIPLHCQMIGETCGEYLSKFLAEKELLIIPKFNFLKLCEDFINKKFEIYCTKNNIDVYSTNTELRKMIALRKRSFENDHMNCSLLVILKQKEIDLTQVEKDVEEFIFSVRNEGEKTGIINAIRRDGTPQFVHKVFAEYFVAQYLSKNISIYENILKTTPSTEKGARFGAVIAFMDEILAKDLPLHRAVLLSDVDDIELILRTMKDKIDVNAVDAIGRTALHVAVSIVEQHVMRRDTALLSRNIDIIELLTNNGASVNIEEKITNLSPFGQALNISEMQWKILSVMFENEVAPQDMKKLIERVRKLENYNYLKLLNIIESGYTKFMRFLICNVEDSVSFETSLFNAAVKENKLLALKFFVESKLLNSRAKDKLMLSALCTACSKGYLEIVKFLITDCNVDPYSVTDYSKSAIICAVSQGNVNVFQYFVETQGKDLKLGDRFNFEKKCSLDCVKHVIKACYGATKATNENIVLLKHMISCQYHVNIIDYFINQCDFNMDSTDVDGNTLLHFACKYLNTAVLRLLVDKYNVNPDNKNRDGITPFLLSAQRSFSAAVHYLYESYHVSPKTLDARGNSALHLSVTADVPDKRVVCYLIEKCGINPELKNSNGETALDISIARIKKNEIDFDVSVINYLQSHKEIGSQSDVTESSSQKLEINPKPQDKISEDNIINQKRRKFKNNTYQTVSASLENVSNFASVAVSIATANRETKRNSDAKNSETENKECDVIKSGSLLNECVELIQHKIPLKFSRLKILSSTHSGGESFTLKKQKCSNSSVSLIKEDKNTTRHCLSEQESSDSSIVTIKGTSRDTWNKQECSERGGALIEEETDTVENSLNDQESSDSEVVLIEEGKDAIRRFLNEQGSFDSGVELLEEGKCAVEQSLNEQESSDSGIVLTEGGKDATKPSLNEHESIESCVVVLEEGKGALGMTRRSLTVV